MDQTVSDLYSEASVNYNKIVLYSGLISSYCDSVLCFEVLCFISPSSVFRSLGLEFNS